MMAEQSQRLYSILGWPVAHSLSPVMHCAAFAELGIDAAYVPCAVASEALGDAIRGLRALGFSGANVTVPHKQAVMPLIDDVDPDARLIGAVNTLVRDGARWVGYNTDAPGFVASLAEEGVDIAGRRVVVLGAGGAARALVVGLARAGAARVSVAARRVAQASEVVDALQPALGSTQLEPIELGRTALTSAFRGSDVVVQSTSATLGGSHDVAAFCAQLPLDALPKHAHVVDIVYNPLKTALLAEAQQRGLRTIGGVGMLVHQGALALRRWTSREAPIDVMRRSVLARLAAT